MIHNQEFRAENTDPAVAAWRRLRFIEDKFNKEPGWRQEGEADLLRAIEDFANTDATSIEGLILKLQELFLE